jgi:hypothetical protein
MYDPRHTPSFPRKNIQTHFLDTHPFTKWLPLPSRSRLFPLLLASAKFKVLSLDNMQQYYRVKAISCSYSLTTFIRISIAQNNKHSKSLDYEGVQTKMGDSVGCLGYVSRR